MLLCLRVDAGEFVESETLKQALIKCGDFHDFVSLLVRHRVLVPVYYVLREKILWSLLSDHIRTDLVGRVRSLQLRQMKGFRALIEITQVFRSKGIEHLCLKGPVLSQLIYRDPIRRQFGDLDLLVERGALSKAYFVLLELGYQSNDGGIVSQRESDDPIWDSLYHIHFQKGEQQIELHWRLSRNETLWNVQASRVFIGKQEVTIAGETLYTLGREHLQLYLTMHGSSHCWNRIKWLHDIRMINSCHPVEHSLPRSESQNSQLGELRDELIQRLWPVSLGTSKAREVSFIGKLCLRQMTTGKEISSDMGNMLRRSVALLILNKGLRNKLRYLSTLLIWPPVYFRFNLPRWASFLYYFLGPLSWLTNKLRGN
ncbi:hypothetical protein VDG1235_4615 [Verrucomicrobiia bacterium DG1235]|nr:hypothetical protein VDG1235_4615 [Verrucomicrobiae bacterium DG1235]